MDLHTTLIFSMVVAVLCITSFSMGYMFFKGGITAGCSEKEFYRRIKKKTSQWQREDEAEHDRLREKYKGLE